MLIICIAIPPGQESFWASGGATLLQWLLVTISFKLLFLVELYVEYAILFPFLLLGTNLTERFRDQFNPMLIAENMPWSALDSTVIRIPLSSECLKDGLELGLKRVKQIFDRFLEHASRALIFMKSILQV